MTRLAWLLLVLGGSATLCAQNPPPDPSPEPKDLGRRLIRKALTDADEDVMETIMRLMDEAAQKLDLDFNPGPETQGVQEQVIAKLDEAISTAAAQTRSQKTSTKQAKGDKRTSPPVGGGRTRKNAPKSTDTRTDAAPDETREVRTGAATSEQAGDELHEPHRTWGQLPLRDREEVLQGAGEESLTRYRVWIDRYYRALQESEEEPP